MQVEITNKTDSEIQFLVDGIKPSFASALRRTMVSEIPTMSIEWVDFGRNDSAMNDEIVATRLGQIPLTFDKESYNLMEECKCEGKGCTNCQVKFAMKKKGPGMVYSGDLKSTDKEVKPVFDNIPVVELFGDQEIQLEATAQLGFGKTHSKWQGAVVGYQEGPVVLEKETTTCPIHKSIPTSKGHLVVKSDCEMCLDAVEATKKKGRVEKLDDGFVFNVESVCGLKAEDVVLSAVDILDKKFTEFGKDLKKLK